MSTFLIKIITSTKVFYEGPCYSVVIPALDGEMEIMANHAEMIVATRPGGMRLCTEENKEPYHAIIGQGFCLIANNRATLLADQIEKPEEVDANRARGFGARPGADAPETEHSGVPYDPGCYGKGVGTVKRDRTVYSLKNKMEQTL